MYDIIGDVHGHADALKSVLVKLGYERKGNGFKHSTRKVLFVGDYIDHGPQIKETLLIVRSMVDEGNAIALMGNHEYNAICYHTKDENGRPLRPHIEKNEKQHRDTIEQFANAENELLNYIEWFKTLPLFYEDRTFRAVHACWDFNKIELLSSALNGNQLTDNALNEAKPGTKLFDALEIVLKGKEVGVHQDYPFTDKYGHKRHELRIKWWANPRGITLQEYSIHPYSADIMLPLEIDENDKHYPENERPVFFGHYWLEGEPVIQRSNICCLDYSVAKGGTLVAYRYNSELELNNQSFIKHS